MNAPGYLDTIQQRALQRLRGRSIESDALLADPAVAAQVASLAVVSDFAIGTLAQQPELLRVLVHGGVPAPPELTPGNRIEWPALLRRYRAAASTRLVWRDVLGHDDVEATLAGSTALAEQCLQLALDALHVDFAERFGVVCRDGVAQRLIV